MNTLNWLSIIENILVFQMSMSNDYSSTQATRILPNCLFSSVFLGIVMEKDNAEFSSNSKGPILTI